MPYRDPAVRAAYHKAYNQRARHRYADYDKAYSAARHANARADHYGVATVITTAEAAAILAEGRCHYCGRIDDGSTWFGLDHVVPLVAAGENRPNNIVCCCHPCNASKFQQPRPYLWARHHDRCIECGTTARPHAALGRCAACDSRYRSRLRRGRTVTS